RDARDRVAAEASTHPLGLASWNGLAQDGTVGGMDADDEATWTYLRRVPAWARPFRGAPHVRERFSCVEAASRPRQRTPCIQRRSRGERSRNSSAAPSPIHSSNWNRSPYF